MSRFRRRAAGAGLVALEVAGVLIAAAAGLAGFVVWRVQSGPVSLAMLRSSAEFAVERALPRGHSANIDGMTLSKGPAGEFTLTLADAMVLDPKGAELLRLAKMEAVFALPDLAQGAFGPRRLVFEKPVISFTRYGRAIKADAAGPGQFDLIRLLNDRAWLRDSFQRAEFRNATIVYADEGSGRKWRSHGAAGTLVRTPDGFNADLAGRFDIDGKPAALSMTAAYVEAGRVIDAELKLADAPVGDILAMFYGDRAAVLEAPVSGLARLKLTDQGVVVASAVDLKAGGGVIRAGARRIPVNAVALTAQFDPETNAFDDIVLSFDAAGSSATATGRVALALGADGRAVRTIAFSLTTQSLILNPTGVFSAPFVVDKASLAGAYDVEERRLALDAIEAAFLDVVVKGSAVVKRPPAAAKLSPAVAINLEMEGALDPPRIARGWPLTLASSVRDFIAARLPAARVDNLKFSLDLAQGALGPGKALPEEALALTFDVAGATAIFTPGMTPLSEASAKARLSGNRFVMTDAKGRVGAVPVYDGVIDFTRLAPKGAPVRYSFSADGDVRDFLKILDEEPLAILKTTPLSPSQFSGKAEARVTITRPNLKLVDRSDYGYSGTLRFQNVGVADFFRGVDLEKASGRIDLRSRSMNVRADAEFGGAPVKIGWLQRFYGQDGPSNFNVAGTVDSSTGDFLGMPTRQMLRGPVDFKAAAVGDLSALRSLSLEVDFTRAALTVESLNWRKPAGASAIGALDASFAPDAVRIAKATLEGADIAVSGKGVLAPGGALQTAEFDRFYLGGAADLAFRAAREENGALKAEFSGAYLDVGPLIKNMVSGSGDPGRPDPWRNGLVLEGRLGEARLRADARFSDAALKLRRAAGLDELSFSAKDAGGKPVEATLAPAAGGAKTIEARSGDIGALFAGVFGVTSIRGGDGEMTMTLAAAPGEKHAVEGRVDARNMRVVRAPLLARIFAAGSFDGLSDLLNGEGIDLARARADFAFSDGVVAIRNARATGPSIGITGEGEINAGEGGAVSLRGAVAPAYQLNSFLGKAPIVGDIFVNRKGEGLVALSYAVSGTTAAPVVAVNPLSALTPGVLRRMFESRDEAAPADEGGDRIRQ
jgi:hypothetical protein